MDGIAEIRFMTFGLFDILRVCQRRVKAILLKDVIHRDPVFAGRFHTNVAAVVFSKPVRQLLKTFGKGREARLLILGTTVCIGDSDAGIDPGFVDIKSTTVKTKNFERQ